MPERCHETLMRMALAEARAAFDKREAPVGAIVVRGDEVLSRAHNLRETRGDPTAHAEILALRAAARATGGWRLEGCTMYVTLEPCPMCAGALVMARIAHLVYGAADPRAGAVDSVLDLVRHPQFNHRLEVTGGVLADECTEILKRFFSELRQ